MADAMSSDEGVEVKRYEFEVQGRHEGKRLDAYLAGRFQDYSRTFIKALIESGAITVNGRAVKPSYSPSHGDRVLALVPSRTGPEVPPQDIPLDILYEDDWIVVLNKPPDLVVHPSRGHQSGTLVNALVHHFQKLSGVNGSLRPGVVHRLDRDTSGVILVIKDDAVHERIARQFEERTTVKEYVAVVEGSVQLDGDVIDAPIGRHPVHREKMAISGRYERRSAHAVRDRRTARRVQRRALLPAHRPHAPDTRPPRLHRPPDRLRPALRPPRCRLPLRPNRRRAPARGGAAAGPPGAARVQAHHPSPDARPGHDLRGAAGADIAAFIDALRALRGPARPR